MRDRPSEIARFPAVREGERRAGEGRGGIKGAFAVALFVSTYPFKVDKKGRVSVPAPFRKAVDGEPFEGVYCFPSLHRPCIQGGGHSYIEMFRRAIEQEFDPLTDDQDNFAFALLGNATPLAFDGDGRVTLTEPLMTAAGIGDAAVFVGLGAYFEIWAPAAFDERMAAAREHAAANRARLARPRSDAGGAA